MARERACSPWPLDWAAAFGMKLSKPCMQEPLAVHPLQAIDDESGNF
eukprot:CAMPEP_0202373438 /NCGR_PEP_ID=MMETSP1127-20130417/4463_1 /ASSEMBLY_ACC=CAM_ASM_000462 /TAXON_ID=3047 /ORGANISM="Dunaliella tertiolecta, Strain CCMP1320" /LENGTH=46 /DNA_ID= /DNA_START= /DNA_END= /DNA_ORIENTATION=